MNNTIPIFRKMKIIHLILRTSISNKIYAGKSIPSLKRLPEIDIESLNSIRSETKIKTQIRLMF